MRPLRTFGGFVGQGRLVGYLKESVTGARRSARAVPHLLLCGGAGTGKTSLARGIANEMETACRYLVAGRALNLDAFHAVARDLRHADVLVVDEAHRLTQEVTTALMIVADEFIIHVTDKASGKMTPVSIAEHTVVLATNRPGEVSQALRTRLTPAVLDEYRPIELVEIAKRTARSINLAITSQAAGVIARSAQGRPRTIARRLEALAIISSDKEVTAGDATAFLAREGIDHRGLDLHQQRYLQMLKHAKGNRLALGSLAAGIEVDEEYVRDDVEPYLVRLGLVAITAQGRTLQQVVMENICDE